MPTPPCEAEKSVKATCYLNERYNSLLRERERERERESVQPSEREREFPASTDTEEGVVGQSIRAGLQVPVTWREVMIAGTLFAGVVPSRTAVDRGLAGQADRQRAMLGG